MDVDDSNMAQKIQDKRNEIFAYHNNKIGLTVAMDGGWQKHGIGSIYNSRTGHDFAFGGYTNKVLSMAAYSKHCRICERAQQKI